MLRKKLTFMYVCLFLCFSCAFCMLEGQQPVLFEAIASDAHLGKMAEDIEQIVQTYASPEYAQKCEELAQEYTKPEFIESVLYPDKKRLEELKAFGDHLIFEIPLQECFGNLAPRIGVYNKDVCEVVFAGAGWTLDYILYKKLFTYFADSMTQRLIAAREKLLFLLDENSGKVFQEAHPEFDLGQNPNSPEIRDLLLALEIRDLAEFRWSDLVDPRFCTIFAAYFASDLITQAVKKHWLLSEQKQYGALGLINLLVNNARREPGQDPIAPVAISSLCDIRWLFNLPSSSVLTNILETVNDFLCQHFDNKVSRALRNDTVEFIRQATMNMLFVAWFNHYVTSVLCAKNLVKHKEELKQLLRSRDEDAAQKMNTFVRAHLGMPGDVWRVLRNQKFAEWRLYYNLLVLVPSCYEITKMVYKVYAAGREQKEAAPATVTA